MWFEGIIRLILTLLAMAQANALTETPPPLAEPAPVIAQLPAQVAPSTPAMHGMINELRAERGLGPLAYDVRLERVAAVRAGQIVTRMMHENYAQLAGEQGLYGGSLGENLARSYTVASAWAMWLDSPGHLANMLDPEWRSMGAAVLEADGICYVVTEFRD